MKLKMIAVSVFLLTTTTFAKSGDWKSNRDEVFSDSEANFKKVMKTVLDQYVDRNLTQDDLYRAATAGMLASLNPGDEAWNKLMSPHEFKEMQSDLTGQVTGIGAEMKFDDKTGHAIILRTIPKSVAEKAGLKIDDQILSVDGKKFKGKDLHDVVNAIRGEAGKSVDLKVLRDDRILTFNIKREIVPWIPVELEVMKDKKAAILTIGYFNEETPKMVEKNIEEINKKGIKDLIVDIRDNSGGGFQQAVQVSELFVPQGAVIVKTKNREGKVEEIKSSRGLLNADVKIFVLTDKETSSGAEFFAATLKENRGAKQIGEHTLGKWNAQRLETLPNKFAYKFTVKEFQSPNGNSFQGKGLRPDVEVNMPEGSNSRELRLKHDVQSRLEVDPQLNAAFELSQMN
jgi:carboxyl-terminal processing protease